MTQLELLWLWGAIALAALVFTLWMHRKRPPRFPNDRRKGGRPLLALAGGVGVVVAVHGALDAVAQTYSDAVPWNCYIASTTTLECVDAQDGSLWQCPARGGACVPLRLPPKTNHAAEGPAPVHTGELIDDLNTRIAPFQLKDLRAEATRELNMRVHYYPKAVARGKLSQHAANRQREMMRKVSEVLERLVEVEGQSVDAPLFPNKETNA